MWKTSMTRLWLAVMLWPTAGCVLPPISVPWRDDQRIIKNEPSDARGSLVVETQVTGVSDQGDELHAPFYVYDPSGR
jgi:hypothetical protein